MQSKLEDTEWAILVHVDFPNRRLDKAVCEVGNDGRAKSQLMITGQAFSHWCILDKALVRLGTKDILIVLVEKESLMLPLLEVFFLLPGEVSDERVVVEEILAEFVCLLFWYILILLLQDFVGMFFKDPF